MTTKIKTRRLVDDKLIMFMISSDVLAAQIMDGADRTDPKDPIYEIKVTISGVEVDFEDFEVAVEKQLDAMIERAVTARFGAMEEALRDKFRALEDVLDQARKGLRDTYQEATGVPLDEAT